MKKLFFVLFSLLLWYLPLSSLTAQDSGKKIHTEEFTVTGVCGMCQKRIEKAALIPGVMSATWNQELQQLKVIYKPKKVTLKDIRSAVAGVGHDTDEIKASNEAYAQLPVCCAYRDGVKTH